MKGIDERLLAAEEGIFSVQLLSTAEVTQL
jgi:hypothetical protein